MTDKILIDRSVLEQVLEALNASQPHSEIGDDDYQEAQWYALFGARKALRAALDAPQQQSEPAALAYYVMNGLARYQLFVSKAAANALAKDMQKRSDLSGNIAAFHVVPLYPHPQNLDCKSNQARLATLWGYTKDQPRQPLTDGVIQELADEGVFHANVFEIVPRIEEEHGIFKLRAHGIGGEV